VLLIGDLVNFVSVPLIVWAIRNTYRFFLFFLACILVLEKEDVEKIFDIMCKFQVLNVILTLYQYFELGKKQDFLGGIFGYSSGCNAYTNIYLALILIYILSKYIYKKVKIWPVLALIFSSLIIAAMAEIKIFFIEFVIIVLMAILLSRPSSKTLKITGFSVIGLLVGLYAFSQMFPGAYQDLININKMIEYNTTVIWGYNISRWGAFKEINEIFFHNNIFLNLFGYGFGNCEYSSLDLFTSNFYRQYGNYHYQWFAHQTWFLEGGYSGFGLFIIFFVLIFIWGVKNKNKLGNYKEFGLIAQIFSVIVIISLWYNCSSRIEVAYLMFFALAAPLVIYKSVKKEKTYEL
jgi:hypothetical protein